MAEADNCAILRRMKSNCHYENIGSLFKELYAKNNLADVTISCHDGSINAHKLVLSAYSSYFNRLLYKSNTNSQTIFIMHKITLQNMKYLLEFMYNGIVEIPESITNELITLAKDLEIKGFDLFDDDTVENNTRIYSVNNYNSRKRNLNQSSNVQTVRQNRTNEKIQARNSTNRLSIESNETDTQSVSTFNTDDSENTERRNTRFKGKKRVPVGEVEDPDEIVQHSPNAKKRSSRVNSVDGLSNIIIKEISGANGSILLNMSNKKSPSPSQQSQQSTQQEKRIKQDITCEKIPLTVEPTTSVQKAIINKPPEAISIAVTPEITVTEERSRQDNVEINIVDNIKSETLTDLDTTEEIRKNTDDNRTKQTFKCNYCNSRFSRHSHLIRHKRIHTGERLYACKRCDKRFSRQDKLKLHMRNQHDDMYDFVPKTEKSKKLYGNQIETSPIQLRQLEESAGESSSVTQSIIQSIKEISTDKSKSKQMKIALEKRGRGRPRIKDKTSESKSITQGSERGKRGRPKRDDVKLKNQPFVKIPRANLFFSEVLVNEEKGANQNGAENNDTSDSSSIRDPIGIEYTDRIELSDSDEIGTLKDVSLSHKLNDQVENSKDKGSQSNKEHEVSHSQSDVTNEINRPNKKSRGRPRVRPNCIVVDSKKEHKQRGRPRIYPVKLKKEKRSRGRPRMSPEKKPSDQQKKARGRPKKVISSSAPENENSKIQLQENYDLATLPYGDFSYLTSELEPHFVAESDIVYPEPTTSNQNIVTSTPCQPTAAIPFNSNSLTITQITNDIKREATTEPSSSEVPEVTTEQTVGIMDNIRLFGECTIRPVT